MNIHKIVLIACTIFQIAHGAQEKVLGLHTGPTKLSTQHQMHVLTGTSNQKNRSTRTCLQKTVACIECTGCTPGCTLCAACTLISCASTPTFLASCCIMNLATAGKCGISAALSNIATKLCLATCLPGSSSLLCCWPYAFIKGDVPPALMLDRMLIKYSNEPAYDETQEAEPLLDATPLNSQLHREE